MACDVCSWLAASSGATQQIGRFQGTSGHGANIANRSLMTHSDTSPPSISALRKDYSITSLGVVSNAGDRQAESVKSQNTTCRKTDIELNRYAIEKVLAAKFNPDLLESPEDRGLSSPMGPLIASRTDAPAERDVDHQASQLSRTGRRDGRGIPYTRAIHTPGRSTWSRDCRCHRAW
jgi:hypothetical protein